MQAEQWGPLYNRPSNDDDVIVNDSKIENHYHYGGAAAPAWLWKLFLGSALLGTGASGPICWYYYSTPAIEKPVKPKPGGTTVLQGDVDLKIGEPYVVEPKR